MSSNIVEALYYKLYNATLLGERDDAKLFLELLRKEFESDADSFSILQNDNRFEHLKQLGNLVDNDLIVRNASYVVNASDVETAEKDDKQADTEVELIRMIFTNDKNISNLKKCLNVSDNFCLSNVQHPTQFGRIDVLAFDNDVVYPIEIKKSEARYSVISQIEKYVLDLKLKLILKLWKQVKGVVIANGYVSQVVKELVKSDIVPIKYTLENDIIKFRRLNAKEKDCDIRCDNFGTEDEKSKETECFNEAEYKKVKLPKKIRKRR